MIEIPDSETWLQVFTRLEESRRQEVIILEIPKRNKTITIDLGTDIKYEIVTDKEDEPNSEQTCEGYVSQETDNSTKRLNIHK